MRCGVAAVRVLQRAEGHSGDGGGSQGLLMNGSARGTLRMREQAEEGMKELQDGRRARRKTGRKQ